MAGNCAVLKPSEVSKNIESLIVELVPLYFDTNCVAVVTGGIQETSDLLKLRFLFF
jgi:aldehyde dehydrogenase (NAD(P)+)